MPIADAVVISILVLCSAATMQAAIHAYATRGTRLRRQVRAVARRYAEGELTRAQFEEHVDALQGLAHSTD